MTGPAIVVLTDRGAELGRRLSAGLGEGEVVPAAGEVRAKLAELFQAGQPLICVMALGIVVRILGPLTRDKATDPAVVVVDEAGQFAVSMLGGHAGGANMLARRVAAALNATPVITTASDALGLPALDLLEHEEGWRLEGRENLTQVMAGLVRGQPIAICQQAGRRREWPVPFQAVRDWPTQGDWAGAVLVSDRAVDLSDVPALIYRPPSLVAGIGCKRGVPGEEIDAFFLEVFRSHGLSPLSLALVATIDLKKAEPGLVEFAARRGVPLRSFSTEQIAKVDVPTPSERVKEKIGVAGVAEPAALLAAGVSELLVAKQKGQRVTLAVARQDC